jgi:hypothetical protein
MQEWNRYSVFKSLDLEPIQGIEVELGFEREKIILVLKARRQTRTEGPRRAQ